MMSCIRRAALPLTLLVVAGTVAACGGGAADAAPTPVVTRDTAWLAPEAVQLAGFALARADSAPWRVTWTAPARLALDPAQTQYIGSIAEGRVTRVLVAVGDAVRAGQVLVTIHSHEMMDAQAAVARARAGDAEAQAALTLATSAAARAERLYEIKALSLADLERARAGLAQARAARAQAQAELDRARALHGHLVGSGPVPAGVDTHEVLVRAPTDGIVVARVAQPGAVVLVGAPLVTVSRTTSLVLATSVPEPALAAVGTGTMVPFAVEAYPGERFTARVTRVAPTLDSTTRTVEVLAQVLGDARKLRAEMYATAVLQGPPGASALGVPASAIQLLAGDTVVVVARPRAGGLELEAVPVRVGRRNAERAEILAGLAPGTQVVADGAAVARAEIVRRRGGA